MVDAGYVTVDQLVASRVDHHIELVGPTLSENHRQARAPGAFSAEDFDVEREHRRVRRPQGHTSGARSETRDPRDRAMITARFDASTCRSCPCRARCTRSAQRPRRLILRRRAQHEALRAARASEKTPEFKAGYAAHAGVGGAALSGSGSVRAARDASPARADSGGDQPGVPRCLAQQFATRHHQTKPPRHTHPAIACPRIPVMNPPTVSTLGSTGVQMPLP